MVKRITQAPDFPMLVLIGIAFTGMVIVVALLPIQPLYASGFAPFALRAWPLPPPPPKTDCHLGWCDIDMSSMLDTASAIFTALWPLFALVAVGSLVLGVITEVAQTLIKHKKGAGLVSSEFVKPEWSNWEI
jgi:hypothetical protein